MGTSIIWMHGVVISHKIFLQRRIFGICPPPSPLQRYPRSWLSSYIQIDPKKHTNGHIPGFFLSAATTLLFKDTTNTAMDAIQDVKDMVERGGSRLSLHGTFRTLSLKLSIIIILCKIVKIAPKSDYPCNWQ